MNTVGETMDLAPLQRVALTVGVVGMLPLGVALCIDPEHFFPSYLVAFLFWLGLSLGPLVWQMVHQLTGGRWGDVSRFIMEAAGRTVFLMLLLFLPLLGGMKQLFVWARPEMVRASAALLRKSTYLNVPFFVVRAAAYFALWMVFVRLIGYWSGRQRQQPGTVVQRRLTFWSAIGILVYLVTISFAAVDWVMSLQPGWSSTAFGAVVALDQGLSGLAFVLVVLDRVAARTGIASDLEPDVVNDLGNLLLSFVMLWSYVTFSEFLIIWSGNLPRETLWYLTRIHGSWRYLPAVLAFVHFALPFGLLLARPYKRDTRKLAGIAWLVLAGSLLFYFYLVLPVFTPSASFAWESLVAPVAIGGLWMAVFAREFSRQVLPRREDIHAA